QFNESMATFVGRAAAQQYFQRSSGQDSPPATAAARRMADLEVIDSYVSDLYQRLAALYSQPISSEDKIARREAICADQRLRFREVYESQLNEPERYRSIINVATDNATVIAAYRYHSKLDLFAAVYGRLQADLRAMIKVLRSASRRHDSFGYLRDWLG